MNIFNLVKTAESIKSEFRELLKAGLNIEKLEKFFQEYWEFFNPNLTDNIMENYNLLGESKYVLDSLVKMLKEKLSSVSSEKTIQTLEDLFEKMSNYPTFYYPIFIRIFYNEIDWLITRDWITRDWIIRYNEKD